MRPKEKNRLYTRFSRCLTFTRLLHLDMTMLTFIPRFVKNIPQDWQSTIHTLCIICGEVSLVRFGGWGSHPVTTGAWLTLDSG